jgi:hypothetical protein
MAEENLVARWEERDEVLRWRYNEAREAGMSDVDANRFAHSRIDLGELRRAVKKGCPPEFIAQVVL